MHLSLPRGAAAMFAVAVACTSAAAQSLFSQYGETVIMAGDAVPGMPGFTIQASSNFDGPVIDQNGNMLMRARIAGAGVSSINDRVYLYGRNAADLRVILRSGDQAPGMATGILLQTATGTGPTGSPRLSPFGEYLFFSSSLNDGGATVTTANDTSLFWGPVGAVIPFVREGDPVVITGVTGAYTYASQSFSTQNNIINSSGQALIQTQMLGAPADQDSVIAIGIPGALVKVSQEGDVMPDGSVVIPVSGTTTLSFINQINESGQVLHELRFAVALPSTATTVNDRALAIWTPGFGDTIVAREGQQAPGLAPGILFANPTFGWTVDTGPAVFTKSGKFALNAQLDQGGVVPSTDDRGVYVGDSTGLTLVLRRNDPTGQPNDVRYGVVNTATLTCNDAGQIACVCSLQNGSVPGTITTTNDSSIVFGSAGNVAPIAVEGSPVPMFPGFTFGQISGGTNTPFLNALGEVLFSADVTDGVNPSRRVLFVYDALHGLRVMHDSLDPITLPSGTTTWFSQGANQFNSGDGGSSHFNNAGDYAVRLGTNSTVVPGVIVRGHAGSLQATPASISSVAGGTQNFAIDVTATHGNNIYVILATSSGTRPGFPSPLGPQTIPLNNDFWTSLSLNLANTGVYANSLWFTDAAGKNMSPASFNLPPAIPGTLGLLLHHAAVILDGSLASTYVTEPVSLKLY